MVGLGDLDETCTNKISHSNTRPIYTMDHTQQTLMAPCERHLSTSVTKEH